jgi:hypothetical protein
MPATSPPTDAIPATRGVKTAREATVRICHRDGRHVGQGLVLPLREPGAIVLTCHHVVAQLTPETLRVAIPDTEGHLREPIPAT